MYSWKKYNKKNERLISKFRKYNKKYNLNINEKSYYNHTRDLLAFNLIEKKKIKVLDYGSNFLACCNFDNKINCKNIGYFIFNPFLEKNEIKKKFGNLNIRCIKNLKNISNKKFDVLNFGSSLQYLDNFEEIIKSIKFKSNSKIIISATPITFLKTYISKQTNAKKLKQKIYSYGYLKRILLAQRFKNIFKSCLDFRMSGLKKKNQTYFMNLIFLKY